MSEDKDGQFSLDLFLPVAKRKQTSLEAADAKAMDDPTVHSLTQARRRRIKEETGKHFREILKLARHL